MIATVKPLLPQPRFRGMGDVAGDDDPYAGCLDPGGVAVRMGMVGATNYWKGLAVGSLVGAAAVVGFYIFLKLGGKA